MIYMVDHIFADPNTESDWHDWYTGYLQHLFQLIPRGLPRANRF